MRFGRLALSRRERGQVVVVFALLLPMILGIGSIVVTIGNWYVHKKHLQTLVDAGAFAGGQEFTGCFQDRRRYQRQPRSRRLPSSTRATRTATRRRRTASSRIHRTRTSC